jgi:hypothetical protein
MYRHLDGEMRERLIGAIYDLTERERLIMTLYYYDETTMKEIGLILGVVEPGFRRCTPPLCRVSVPGSQLPRHPKNYNNTRGHGSSEGINNRIQE